MRNRRPPSSNSRRITAATVKNKFLSLLLIVYLCILLFQEDLVRINWHTLNFVFLSINLPFLTQSLFRTDEHLQKSTSCEWFKISKVLAVVEKVSSLFFLFSNFPRAQHQVRRWNWNSYSHGAIDFDATIVRGDAFFFIPIRSTRHISLSPMETLPSTPCAKCRYWRRMVRGCAKWLWWLL